MDRVAGRIDAKDLTLIFARAAEAKQGATAAALGRELLEAVLAKSRETMDSSDELPALGSQPAASPRSRKMDLAEMRQRIDDILAKPTQSTEIVLPPGVLLGDLLEEDAEEEEPPPPARPATPPARPAQSPPPAPARRPDPTPQARRSAAPPPRRPTPARELPPRRDEPAPLGDGGPQFRRQGGKLGTRTLEELFIRGGRVRFDGYLGDIESLLIELYDRFLTASNEVGGITAADIESGNLLGAGGSTLESRRAKRMARRHSDRFTVIPGEQYPLRRGREGEAAPAARRPTAPLAPSVPRAPQRPGQPGTTWHDREPPRPAAPVVRPGVIQVRCGCGVERAIDTTVLRPWRVRCQRCSMILFDPGGTLVVGDTRQVRDSTEDLNRLLSASRELIPLDPAETQESVRCQLHPKNAVVAACKLCSRLLCQACVEEVDGVLVCGSCAERAERAKKQTSEIEAAVEEDLDADPGLDPREVRRAFERALSLACLEAALERRGPGGKRLQLIYDQARGVFKAPLEPRLSAGDRFRLADGRSFAIQAVRTFDVGGVPCYQELTWVELR